MQNYSTNMEEFLDILDNPSDKGLEQFENLKKEIINNSILHGIVIDILKREYIYNYIYGNFERAINSKSIFKLFNLNINPNIVITIIYDNFWVICEKDNNTSRYKLKRNLIDATNYLLKDVKSVATTLIGTDKVIVLIDCENRSEKEAIKYVEDISNNLLIELEKITKYSVSIGVSSYKKDEHFINEAYEESFRALNNIFKTGKRSIVYDKNYNNIDDTIDIYNHLHDLIIEIGHNNLNKSYEILDIVLDFFKYQNYDSNYIKSISLIYLFEISNYFNFEDNKDGLNDLIIKNLNELLKSSTLNEINAILKEYIASLVGYFKKMNSIYTGVNIALSYIKKYYMLDISLEKISYIAGFSPYYFSRNFKKITGINFINYLLQIRMENAKTLLETSDNTIYEISVDVGFDDFSYFSKTFKNFYNMSPSSYRNKFKKFSS